MLPQWLVSLVSHLVLTFVCYSSVLFKGVTKLVLKWLYQYADFYEGLLEHHYQITAMISRAIVVFYLWMCFCFYFCCVDTSKGLSFEFSTMPGFLISEPATEITLHSTDLFLCYGGLSFYRLEQAIHKSQPKNCWLDSEYIQCHTATVQVFRQLLVFGCLNTISSC